MKESGLHLEKNKSVSNITKSYVVQWRESTRLTYRGCKLLQSS